MSTLTGSSMIAGVKLPENKHVVQSLQAITGIGRSSARKICKDLEIEESTIYSSITEQQKEKIRNYIKEHYIVEGELRRFVHESINALMTIGCYRGRRHRAGLPVRGQRSKTNAKTCRKKRKKVKE
jgi:small subunit ribosomal protein S13